MIEPRVSQPEEAGSDGSMRRTQYVAHTFTAWSIFGAYRPTILVLDVKAEGHFIPHDHRLAAQHRWLELERSLAALAEIEREREEIPALERASLHAQRAGGAVAR